MENCLISVHQTSGQFILLGGANDEILDANLYILFLASLRHSF